MGLTIKNNQKLAVVKESTPGVYEAPASGADFVQSMESLELSTNKETNERSLLNGSIGQATPRSGARNVSASVEVEMKSGDQEGLKPEFSPLIESCLGAVAREVSASTTDHTNGTSTTTQIFCDSSLYEIGDVITIKTPSAYHTSPIESKDVDSVTLLIPADNAPSDLTPISKSANYKTANQGHASLSVSKYVEDSIIEKGIGCYVSNLSVNNFSTGSIPSLSFGLEGIDFDKTLAAPPFTPVYDTSFPPVVLSACAYLNGVKIDIAEFSLSVENTLAWTTPTCSSSGRKSGRISNRAVTGSILPYKLSDSLANYNMFKDMTEFSLCIIAQVPSSNAGEYDQTVAIYIPKVVISELSESDADGILQDSISFTASRGADGSTEELYMSFI